IAAAGAGHLEDATPPARQPPRQAVERGLAFLQKDAAKWRAERKCASCHEGTMTVWALAEAKSDGYPIAAETLAEAKNWTDATLLAYLALRPRVPADAKNEATTRDSRVKATAWLAKAQQGAGTQAAALRLLVKAWTVEPPTSLRAEIERFLGRQNKDGGWGQL